MIDYSAFGRGSNYELISFTIDGEISVTSRIEIVRADIYVYATPLAYIIKAILIRDAITCENTKSARNSWKFIKLPHINPQLFDRCRRSARALARHSYGREPTTYYRISDFVSLITRPIELVSATWRFSKNTMQISYYINKVWRWIILAINNTEGHFASSRPAECALGRTSRASYFRRDLLSR